MGVGFFLELLDWAPEFRQQALREHFLGSAPSWKISWEFSYWEHFQGSVPKEWDAQGGNTSLEVLPVGEFPGIFSTGSTSKEVLPNCLLAKLRSPVQNL